MESSESGSDCGSGASNLPDQLPGPIKKTVSQFQKLISSYLQEYNGEMQHNEITLPMSYFNTLKAKGMTLTLKDVEMVQMEKDVSETLMSLWRQGHEGRMIKRKGSVAFKRCLFGRSIEGEKETSEDSVYEDVFGIITDITDDEYTIVFNCDHKQLKDLCKNALALNNEVLSRQTMKMESSTYQLALKYNLVMYYRCEAVGVNLVDAVKTSPLMMSVFRFLTDEHDWKDRHDSEDKSINDMGENIVEILRTLNIFQQQSIIKAIKCESFYLIHGPPGTGKTETVTCLLQCLVELGKTVLICSEQNKAVDLILSKFSKTNQCVKLGTKGVVRTGAKHLVEEENWEFLFKKLDKQEVTARLDRDGRIKRPIPKKGDRHPLETASVVFSTLCSTYSNIFIRIFEKKKFDYVIVDEAGMSSVPFTLMAMKFAKKIVFSGDHHQLPPVIKSPNDELRLSLFERLIVRAKNSRLKLEYPIFSTLWRQYRMNSLIAKASNNRYYGGSLDSHERVTSDTLLTRGKADGEYLPCDCPLVWIDHKGKEQQTEYGFTNPTEFTIVNLLLKDLQGMGVQAKDIGVVTAYNHQRDDIKRAFEVTLGDSEEAKALHVSSVEGFQGGEKDVIIYASTRGNNMQRIGFLREERKLNVAITRAKLLFIIVANTKTIVGDRQDSFYTDVYNLTNKEGLVLTYQFHKKKHVLKRKKDGDQSQMD